MTIALITLAVAFIAREVLHGIENDRIRAAEAATRASEAAERHAWAQERQTLLQRIQAPREAVIQHMQGNPADDESYPLHESETAARLDAETAAQIAQMEQTMNEHLGLLIPGSP